MNIDFVQQSKCETKYCENETWVSIHTLNSSLESFWLDVIALFSTKVDLLLLPAIKIERLTMEWLCFLKRITIMKTTTIVYYSTQLLSTVSVGSNCCWLTPSTYTLAFSTLPHPHSLQRDWQSKVGRKDEEKATLMLSSLLDFVSPVISCVAQLDITMTSGISL